MNAVEQWLTGRGETIACPMGARLTPEQCRGQQALAVSDPVARITCYGCHHSELPDHAPMSIPGATHTGTCRVCGVEVVATRYYCDEHRPGMNRGRWHQKPAVRPEESVMSEQPTVVEPTPDKKNGHKRRFTTDDYRRLLAEHDALPPRGGHRKTWIAEHGLSTGTLAKWRRLVEAPTGDEPDEDPRKACASDLLGKAESKLARANAEIMRAADRQAEAEATIARLKGEQSVFCSTISDLQGDVGQLKDESVREHQLWLGQIETLHQRLAAAEAATTTEVEDANAVIADLKARLAAAERRGKLFARIEAVYRELNALSDDFQELTTTTGLLVSAFEVVSRLEDAITATRKAALHVAAFEAQGWTGQVASRTLTDEDVARTFGDEEIPG